MNTRIQVPVPTPLVTAASAREGVRLSRRARDAAVYASAVPNELIELHLEANEGPVESTMRAGFTDAAQVELARRYPVAAELERAIAGYIGVDAERVLVTAGGDDGIDRACRAVLEEGRRAVLATPTFEMIERSALGAGAEVVRVPWDDRTYPLEAVLDNIDERTGMIAVVSPNNPTGAVAVADDLRALSRAAPEALLLVDLAYTEFADKDLTPAAVSVPNAVIVRTFSKAFGLAGLRVGYVIGPVEVIRAMRALGSPYPVAGPSLRAALAALGSADATLPAVKARAGAEREVLAELLQECGALPWPSQANFVLAEFDDAAWVRSALASLGVAVRGFAAGRGLDRALRITCPCCPVGFDHLCRSLRTVLRPEALLLDMDGVIADVSRSYRRAIVETAGAFGVTLTAEDVTTAKEMRDANNDWVVTQRLLAARGVDAPLGEVTARFESLYQGGSGRAGLHELERLIPSRDILIALAAKTPLAVVTGRPRKDCERFLVRFGISELFQTLVCMEDAAIKPDPAPLLLALNRLGVQSAWMVGDTPDDIEAARRARVLPLGIVAPGGCRASAERLTTGGAAAVLDTFDALLEIFP